MSRRLKLCCYALAWIAASVVATLLIANLSLGNKEIDKPLQHLLGRFAAVPVGHERRADTADARRLSGGRALDAAATLFESQLQ